ncbi:MAG TPA: hypothetical protein VGN61_02030, partial [Verrucomicrobiae bacterium]
MVKVTNVVMCLSLLAGAARLSGASVSIGGNVVNGVVWVDDALPSGAQPGADGGDGWNWISSNPTPYSGTLAHESSIENGLHEHYFTGATQPLTINAGDTLFTAVYIDPANVPSEIMLQWNDSTGSWAHRAYWGDYLITYGANGSAGSYYMGPMPAAGQWTLLQVPASDVGLGGIGVDGMAFSEYNGRATWDFSGDATSITNGSSSGTTTNPPSNTGTNSTTGTGSGGSGSTSPVTISTNSIPGTTPID